MRTLLLLWLSVGLIPTFGQSRIANEVIQQYYQPGDSGLWFNFSNQQPQIIGHLPCVPGECAAAISDTAGTLQFYISGENFYNVTGSILYQSLDAYWSTDATQGALILPRPGSPSLYDAVLLQSTPLIGPDPHAGVVTIDMSLNGGLGGEVSDVTFSDHLTEKLTATPNASRTGYWVLMHEWGTDAFRAFSETSTGLDTVPVISHAGTIHSIPFGGCPDDENYQGEMKFSYAGDRVALGNANVGCPQDTFPPSIVQLFHFDDATGAVTYWLDLPNNHLVYGLEFSLDGNKLYVSGADSVHYVDQYDLAAGDTTAIRDSRYRIYAAPYAHLYSFVRPTALEFGPDGRIYASRSGVAMDAIQYPNVLGSACEYTTGFLQFPDGDHGFAAHWNHLKRYLDSEFKGDASAIPIASEASTLHLWPSPVTDGMLYVGYGPSLNGASLTIHDALGRMVYGPEPIRSNAGIDVSGLASGTYSVTLAINDRVVGRARFVVR